MIKIESDLDDEMAAWDAASDEDFKSFIENLESTVVR